MHLNHFILFIQFIFLHRRRSSKSRMKQQHPKTKEKKHTACAHQKVKKYLSTKWSFWNFKASNFRHYLTFYIKINLQMCFARFSREFTIMANWHFQGSTPAWLFYEHIYPLLFWIEIMDEWNIWMISSPYRHHY